MLQLLEGKPSWPAPPVIKKPKPVAKPKLASGQPGLQLDLAALLYTKFYGTYYA